MIRAWDAVKGAIVRAWTVLVRLVRQGLIRQVITLAMFVAMFVSTVRGDYPMATLALVWVIYLDLQDPNRPGRVIVPRRER